MSKPVINVDFQKTTLRLPKHLHQELSDLAARNGTSMNTEILQILLHRPLGDRVESLSKRTDEIKLMTKEILDAVRTLK